ncbi:MAG: DUF3108 domain-containing protein [Dongiaceae bacterium]
MSLCRVMLRRLPLGLAALAVLAVVGLSSALAERPGVLELGYLAYLGEFEVARVDVVLDLAPLAVRPGPYRMAADVALVGAMGRLFPFRIEAQAEGTADAAGVRPARYRSTIDLWETHQAVALTYRPGGAVEVASDPPTVEAREARENGFVDHTMDPLSAAVAVIDGVVKSGACRGTMKVFDGARRYDLLFSPVGRGQIAPSDAAYYAGPATECAASARLLGGFGDVDLASGLYPATTRLWLAPVVAGAPAVPVRILAENVLGSMRLDLVEVRRNYAAAP